MRLRIGRRNAVPQHIGRSLERFLRPDRREHHVQDGDDRRQLPFSKRVASHPASRLDHRAGEDFADRVERDLLNIEGKKVALAAVSVR